MDRSKEKDEMNWSAINRFRIRMREQEDTHIDLAKEAKKQTTQFDDDMAIYLRMPGVGNYVRSLPDRIAKKREQGRQIIAAEIGGQASGASIGVHHTYAMLLEKSKDKDASDDVSITEGDMFDSNDVEIFLKDIYAHLEGPHGKSLDLVFVRPWSGLNPYQNSEYAMIRLYELLRELYVRLKDDGEMIIQKEFLNSIDPGTLATAAIKSNLSILNWCFTEGPYVVIKREGGPPQLPPLGALLSSLTLSQRENIRERSGL